MTLAVGTFDVEQIISATSKMARGELSEGKSPVGSHSDGFGLIWSDSNEPNGFQILRETEALGTYSTESLLHQGGTSLAQTKMLAIHARFALQPHQKGLRYNQPLPHECGEEVLFFMHNGFTPYMYRNLGMRESIFDSQEYFNTVKILLSNGDIETPLLGLLESMGEPTASGNFFLIDPDKALVFNWWPQFYDHPEYSQMHRYDSDVFTIVSSEMLTSIVPMKDWTKLPKGALVRLNYGL